jgi:diamine N-acetyltransferase
MHDPRGIRLRALEPADAALMYEWENDPRTWEYSDRRWPVSMADLEALVEHSELSIWQTRQMRLMIEDEGRRTVGCIDIFDFDTLSNHCSVGVLVVDAYRRKGYAREALRQVEEMCFRTFGVVSISATAETGNTASIRLFEAAGYERAGLLRDWVRHGEEYSDVVIFQKRKQRG